MTDLTDVLHRATDGLSPEAPDLLLERAVRRGSGLRRRRHAITAASAVSGVAAAGVVVALLLGRSGPTTERPTSIDSAPTASTSLPPPDARVTVDRHDFGATFAAVLPGTITREHDVPGGRVHEKGGYESDFSWNGFPVALRLVPYDGPARTRCEAAVGDPGGGQSCVQGERRLGRARPDDDGHRPQPVGVGVPRQRLPGLGDDHQRPGQGDGGRRPATPRRTRPRAGRHQRSLVPLTVTAGGGPRHARGPSGAGRSA